MLIILKEPFKAQRYDVLAVNLETFDEIIVFNDNNRFSLRIVKFHDGHFSNHSYLNHTLDTFDSYQSCLELFQKLCEALESGTKVFDLRPDPGEEKKDKKRHPGVL